MKKLKIVMLAAAAAMLSSCDLSQIPGLDGKLSIEDSKAVGAACRHSGRALEDCFALNPKTHPAGVFEGWRDMNDYMVANQIDVVKPEVRNSAFQPEAPHAKEEGAGSHGSPTVNSTEKLTDNAAASSAEPVPAVPGRQRWTPKGASEPLAQSRPVEEAPAQVAEPALEKQEPASEQAPAAPARPWERKKDPKKHT